jgi:hypothetical protein
MRNDGGRAMTRTRVARVISPSQMGMDTVGRHRKSSYPGAERLDLLPPALTPHAVSATMGNAQARSSWQTAAIPATS